MSKKNCLRKRRYEYYKGTTEIMDNGANKLVEDVVNVLNQKDYNIIELIKIKQFQAQRIADLEAKLAEKERELKQLKLDLGMFSSVNAFINGYGIEKAREVLLQTEKTKRQDKISFAIEQLEKVKELMRSIDMPNKPELYNNDMFGAGFDSHYIRVEELIDNQINELKGKV